MAIPMVAFWGGRDNAIWFTYPVKDLYDVEANILTSPKDNTKDSGTVTKPPPSGSGTYDPSDTKDSGTRTSGSGAGIGKIKSPFIANYYGK